MSFLTVTEFLQEGDHTGRIQRLPDATSPSVAFDITERLTLHCGDVVELDKLIATLDTVRSHLANMQGLANCATCDDTRVYQEPGLREIPCPDCASVEVRS